MDDVLRPDHAFPALAAKYSCQIISTILYGARLELLFNSLVEDLPMESRGLSNYLKILVRFFFFGPY